MVTTSPGASPTAPGATAKQIHNFTPGSKRWLPVFIVPICVGLALVYVAAAIGIALSFTSWDLISPAQWLGVGNFTSAFGDPRFWKAMSNTALLVILTVPAKIAIGLGLGVAMTRVTRFGTFFRLALFFPTTCHVVSVAFIWMYLYDVDGLLNQFRAALGWEPVFWMGPDHALTSIAVMVVWGGVGYIALLYVAGLQTIPQEYYDAAEIDGANAWQRFRYVTFPLLTPTTFFVLIISLIAGFQTFGEVFILKGPLDSTLTIMAYIYERAFGGLQMGYAAALSVFLIVILLSMTAIQLKVQKKWVNYDI
ncbi:carbohydrate ABC transporter permease [Microbacterium sp. W4I20]|uniref:carbohydrate ABC transporter permease n=1 Tax=Microbacterium sp. W4I20 TaxID=3042262 RepID=UPI002785CE7E|nr:sugar ABC transporter permease [Microbacterium sp. W4I20]MDQ0726725.1 multiple sugar transport system permease protein [Microbacterium sp. W4I20]